ncbi:MAG: hypothetical protein CME70_02760 [Halobacteriovorax sp.]|nr:hypothetical protein [Halobacteriovorax sp.]|tara:strand:- start:5311 stop:7341 length:2031 start_codon:yes stop_codon:yes gene_type:complete
MKALLDDIKNIISSSKTKQSFSGIEWPIAKVSGNEIISRKNVKSYAYEYIGKDIDQLSPEARLLFILKLRAYLNKASSGNFYKFYLKNNRIFVNTTEENARFFGGRLEKLDNPLSIHFEGGQIYGAPYFGPDYYKVNGLYYRIISFESNSFSTNKIDFAEFSGHHELMVQFIKRKTAVVDNKLAGKEKLHGIVKGASDLNITSEEAKEELRLVRKQLEQKVESLFFAYVSLFVSANTLEELNSKTIRLLNILDDEGHTPFFETHSLQEVYKSTLFGVSPLFGKYGQEFNTSVLSNILPLSVDKVSSFGKKYFSRAGNDVYLDLMDLGDGLNVLWTGPTGRGKSVTARDYAWDLIESTKMKLLILEYGDSSERFVKWHKGVSYSDKIPFLMFKEDPHYLLEIFLSQVDRDKDNINTVDSGKIYERIKKGIEEDAFNSVDDFIDYVSEDYEEFKYYFSEIRDYLDDESELPTEAKIIHCNIKFYPKRMKKVVLAFFMKWFEMYEGDIMLLLDELYKFIKKEEEDVGSYIDEFIRTFRKEGKPIWLFTQNLTDKDQIAYFEAMTKNCDVRVCFREGSEISSLSNFKSDHIVTLNSLFYEEISSDDVGTSRSEVKFAVLGPTVNKVLRHPKNELRYTVLNTDKDFTTMFKNWETGYGGRFHECFRESVITFMEARRELGV